MASVIIEPIDSNESASAESIAPTARCEAPIPAPKKRSRKKVEELEQSNDPSPIEEPEIAPAVPRAAEPALPVAVKAPPGAERSAPEEPPKKRGRPKGSKNVEKSTSNAQSTHVEPTGNAHSEIDIETHLVNYLLERKTREVNNRRDAWRSLGHLAVGW